MSANGLGSAVSPLALKIVGAVITALWVFSIMMDAFVPSYDPPDSIGLVFMSMVSAVLGSLALRGKDDKQDPERREADRRERATEEGDE